LFFFDSEKYKAKPISGGCIKFKCGTGSLQGRQKCNRPMKKIVNRNQCENPVRENWLIE